MRIYSGNSVYGAIAIGRIFLFRKKDMKIRRIHIDDTEAEKQRLKAAKAATAEQLQEIYEKALQELGKITAQIFETHLMMLEDEDYNESIYSMIDSQNVNAEYAVSVTSDKFAEMFSSMDDAYMQARATDVRDISNRIIANLMNAGPTENSLSERMVVCADDLAPSETVSLDKDKVVAFVTARGSIHSHSVILARNMNVPAVIGVGDKFLEEVCDGEEMIVDGFTGEIFVNPDERTKERLLLKQKTAEKRGTLLQELREIGRAHV